MKKRIISLALALAMLVTFIPVIYAGNTATEFLYDLSSQAFSLSTDSYVSASNSQSSGVLKYAGKNQSTNTNRNKEGGWVASSADTTSAVIRHLNSLSYTYIRSGNNKWGYVADGGRNNIYSTAENLYMNFSSDKLDAGTYITLKIDVPVSGKYDVAITPVEYALDANNWVGTVADIYIVSPEGYSAESWLSGKKVTSVRYFTNDVATGSFNAQEAGDYYVVFDYTKNDSALQEVVGNVTVPYYVAQTKSIKITRTGDVQQEDEEEGFPFKVFNFRGVPSGVTKPHDMTLANYDWCMNKTLSDSYVQGADPGNASKNITYFLSNYLLVNAKRGNVFAMDIKVDRDGFYSLQFIGGRATASGISEIYVDNKYVGEYNFYSSEVQKNGYTQKLRPLELKKGTHTVVFKAVSPQDPTPKYAENCAMYIAELRLIGNEALPSVESVSLGIDDCSLFLGDSKDLSLSVKTIDGGEFAIHDTYDGSVDSTLSFSIESDDSSVIQVGENNKLTAVGEGIAKVTLNVNGVSKVVNITVEPVVFSQLDISCDKEYLLLDEEAKVSFGGKYSNGTDIAPSDVVAVTYASSAETVAIVTDDGIIKPVAQGKTKITVNVTVGEKTLSKTFEMIVSRDIIYPEITIDFRAGNQAQGVTSPLEATIENSGWKINREKSHEYVLTTSPKSITNFLTNYMLVNTHRDKPIVIDVNVPKAGYYSIYLAGGTSTASGITKVYVDGKYIGEYNFYSPTTIASADTVKLRPLYLSAEVHEITFYPAEPRDPNPKYSQNCAQYIASLSFTGMRELPQATALTADIEEELYVGATVDVDVSVRLTDGTEYRIEKMLSGEDEETNTYSLTSTDEEVVVVNPDGTVKAVGTGKAGIVISADIEGSTIEKTVPVTVGSAVFDKVELQFSSDRLFIGGQITASVRALLDNGEEINSRDYSVVISSNPDSVATTEGNVITGVSEGNIEVTAEVWFNEEMKSKTETLMVEPVKLSAIEASVDKKFISLLDDTGGKISVKGVNNDGSDASIEGALLTYKAIDTEFVDVTEDGFVKAKAAGLADIEVTADIGGIIFTDILTVVASSAKSAPTIYTYSMRENAKENAGKYDWAKALKKDAVTNADEFLVHLDELYEMIPYEGIPRAFMVGLKMDPNGYSCIYCGEDLRNSYGSYAWKIDPFARPWKIQCPSCKRLFPSNDFGSFYKLGFDEHGQFNVERARQKHHEMLFHTDGSECEHIAPKEENSPEWYEFYGYGNDKGYLYNELYSEVGTEKSAVKLGEKEAPERWAVDDGLGYVTGEIAGNDKPEKKTFIAYYNSFGLWVRNGGSEGKYIIDALDNLRDAYLYTGDEKYGRAGAILVDRIADVYPSYDLRTWAQDYPNSDGGRNTGKIAGSIWDCGLIDSVIRAYDAFYPAMDDEYVIEYLSAKAEEYNLENTKTSADLIRENCETGILRETFRSAKTAQVYGNFGMHQQAVALAGVALDAEAETREMFDWLAAYSSLTKDGVVVVANSGGEMLTRYINDVDRDGFGNEVGAGYNKVWYADTLKIAELLQNYEFDTEIDLYENPKYIKMLSAQISMTLANGATLAVGDEGSTASTAQTMKPDTQVLAFARTGIPRFAQLAYYLNGNSVEDLHLDIFEKDPEEIQGKIIDVIEKYGEFELNSENKAGFGLAIVRDGALYSTTGPSIKKDTRSDVWMYYGRNNTAHAHYDKLSLGIDAYGFNFMPDLGYPAATGSDPNRNQWVNATISHNTVVVNEKNQNKTLNAKPLHFDDSVRVKVIDVDASNVYSETSIYRRTAVTVKANDDVAYTVDFFRVKGGKDHIYSLHTQSDTAEVVYGLDPISQTDEKGEFVGSYAGEEVPFGNDPDTVTTDSLAPLKYPRGYTWLRNIRRDAEPETGSFAVNFKQKDFNKSATNGKNLNMRITMLNDWIPTDVTLAVGETPLIAANENIPELDYLLVRRSGEDLDTLYTSVLEPYMGERYIADLQAVDIVLKSGFEDIEDTAKAIKVSHTNGKVDYIIYATNNAVMYTVSDTFMTADGTEIPISFDFRGIVGVYTLNSNGKNIYSYVNDGDVIGENVADVAAFDGKIVAFTEAFSEDNSITVRFTGKVDLSSLIGKYIYVSNIGNHNGTYLIRGAEENGANVVLDVGDVTHITQFAVASNTDSGYTYNISKGQSFVIPFANVFENGPVFEKTNQEFAVSAGSRWGTKVIATSGEAESITYSAHSFPRGASINAVTGEITWKPDASQVGENHFAVTATDESGREDVLHFDVQVYGSTTGSKPETSESDRSDETSASNGGGGGGGGGGTASDNANSSDQTDAGEKDPVLSQDNVNGSTQPDAGDGSSDVPNFIDLGNYAWAADAINALAQNGIIKGTTSDTYSPANNITRADFALLLVRAFKLTSDNKENFSDVSAADYFAPELAIARNTGIVNGIGDNEFAPRSFITRQDMMIIVYRTLLKLNVKLEESSTKKADTYEDYSGISGYAKDAVTALVNAGLVNGKDGHIAPADYTTRAEVAVLIYRILEYIK